MRSGQPNNKNNSLNEEPGAIRGEQHATSH
jgi:hypothetical protein